MRGQGAGYACLSVKGVVLFPAPLAAVLLYATLASRKLCFFSEEQSKAEIESWMEKPQNLKGVLNSACSTLSTRLRLSPGKCAR